MKKRTFILCLACLFAISLFAVTASGAENKGEVKVTSSGFTVKFTPTEEDFSIIAQGVAAIDPAKFTTVSLYSTDDATLARIAETYPNIADFTVSNAGHGSKGHVGITTLAPLAKLTKLRVLTLQQFPNGKDMDLSVLATATELKHVKLQNNTEMDTGPLGKIPSIEGLDLASTTPNLACVANLPNLKLLSINANPLDDYGPIGKSTVATLMIDNINQELDLGFLGTMPNIERLNIRRQEGLSNFAAIGNLTTLKDLRLEAINTKKGDPVDLSFISKLPELQTLNLINKTPVINFESLAGTTKLFKLDMDKTAGVTTLAPLKGLEKLSNLGVSKGAFSEEELTGFANPKIKIYQR